MLTSVFILILLFVQLIMMCMCCRTDILARDFKKMFDKRDRDRVIERENQIERGEKGYHFIS